MALTLTPGVICSRDGMRAVEVVSVDGPFPLWDRDAFGIGFYVRQRPEGENVRVVVVFSTTATPSDDARSLGLPGGSNEQLLVGFALAALGEHLDTAPLSAGAHIDCNNSLFNVWVTRPMASDRDVSGYIGHRLYRSWQFNYASTEFGFEDLLRLRVSMRSLQRVSERGIDRDWRSIVAGADGLVLKPLPALLDREEVALDGGVGAASLAGARTSSAAPPQAFISHDSRDKDAIARPIASGLLKLGCTVWFDEFTLLPGDRLRESIEKGLRECHKCVLVVTPNFLGNTGWTRAEFNSVFTREILEKRDVVVPVWDRVTARQVYDYSSALADRVAAQWSLGVTTVCRLLYESIASSTQTG